MYIEPNSDIKFYKNVPLDMSYANTLYFANVTSQNNYFHNTSSILIATIGQNSYQRVERKRMRVGISADRLYNCNYLAFRNTNFGTKWFYAFVTSVDYVNNVTCEVTYELDSIQTYFLDCSLGSCFVEREHSVTDNFGDNRESEPVITEYVYNNFQSIPVGLATGFLDPYYYILYATAEEGAHDPPIHKVIVNGTPIIGAIYGNLSQSASQETKLNDLLEAVQAYYENGTENRIVGCFKVPINFYKSGYNAVPSQEVTDVVAIPQNLSGYTPKNNKMFQFPFVKIYAENREGSRNEYCFEDFTNHNAKFKLYGDCSPVNDYIVLIPMNYKKKSQCYDNGVSTSGVIPISFGGSVNWTEKEQEQFRHDIVSSISKIAIGATMGYASGFAKGGYVGGAIGGITAAGFTSVQQGLGLYDEQFKMGYAEPSANATGSNKLWQNLPLAPFEVGVEYLNEDVAKAYDDFFTAFGYQTNKNKVPNISSRPHWNHVKTKNCVVRGNAPSDDISIITNCFNRGITFWKNASEVGNYSLDNSPN